MTLDDYLAARREALAVLHEAQRRWAAEVLAQITGKREEAPQCG